MSTSRLPHLVPARHGIHLVVRSQKKVTALLLSPTTIYKLAAASAALLLLMTVC
jgi:hypothetical protein